MAIVYACMVVRSYFLSRASTELAHSSVLASQATLCEILALKLLCHFASSKLQLVAVLTTPWNPLVGAPLDVVEEVKGVVGPEEALESLQSAIEVGIDHFFLLLSRVRCADVDGNNNESQGLPRVHHRTKCCR